MTPSFDQALPSATAASGTPVPPFKRMMRGIGALAMLFSLVALMLASFGDDKGQLAAPISIPDARAAVPPPLPARIVDTAPAPLLRETMIGMSTDAIVEMLGPIVFTRQEGRSKLLRFAHESCTLFVFVFQADGIDRVEHVESRASGTAAAVTVDDCLASLQRERALLAAAR